MNKSLKNRKRDGEIDDPIRIISTDHVLITRFVCRCRIFEWHYDSRNSLDYFFEITQGNKYKVKDPHQADYLRLLLKQADLDVTPSPSTEDNEQHTQAGEEETPAI